MKCKYNDWSCAIVYKYNYLQSVKLNICWKLYWTCVLHTEWSSIIINILIRIVRSKLKTRVVVCNGFYSTRLTSLKPLEHLSNWIMLQTYDWYCLFIWSFAFHYFMSYSFSEIFIVQWLVLLTIFNITKARIRTSY